jgi:hypothetical protein
MDPKNSFPTYMKHAFQNWYNYGGMILFGGLTLIFQEPAWLFIGSGLELGYLFMLSTNPRFQRLVDAELEEAKSLKVEELARALFPHIDQDLRTRYGELDSMAARLRTESLPSGAYARDLLKENQRKLAVLLASYLKIAVAVTRYRHYLGGINPDSIKRDVTRLEKEIESAGDRIKEVKAKNLEILKKRLDKIDKAKVNSEYLAAQMEAIEDTMRLVVDQAVTLTDPKGMGTQIDNLLQTLQDTELIAAEMEPYAEFEAGYSEELDLPEK